MVNVRQPRGMGTGLLQQPPIALVLCCACLLISAAGGQPQPIKYDVTNDVASLPSGQLFDKELGVDFTRALMPVASQKVWDVLGVAYPGGTNPHNQVSISITNTLPRFVMGVTRGNRIDIDMENIMDLSQTAQERRGWLVSLVYHEMTHVWQKRPSKVSPIDDPQGKKLKGIREGTADYVTIEAGHWSLDCVGWKPRGRETWYSGYCPTAHFFRNLTLEYNLTTFVADLNREVLLHGYKDSHFVTLLNATADVLWAKFISQFPAQPHTEGNVLRMLRRRGVQLRR